MEVDSGGRVHISSCWRRRVLVAEFEAIAWFTTLEGIDRGGGRRRHLHEVDGKPRPSTGVPVDRADTYC